MDFLSGCEDVVQCSRSWVLVLLLVAIWIPLVGLLSAVNVAHGMNSYVVCTASVIRHVARNPEQQALLLWSARKLDDI